MTTAGTVAKAVERANDLRYRVIASKQKEDLYWTRRHDLHRSLLVASQRLRKDIAAIDEWRAIGVELEKLGEPPGYDVDMWRKWEEARDEAHLLMCEYNGLEWTITDEDFRGPF